MTANPPMYRFFFKQDPDPDLDFVQISIWKKKSELVLIYRLFLQQSC